MTKEELRKKAIECVSDIANDCEGTPCEHCARFEDCKQITQTTDLLANEIWAYEHGFADGVEEGKQKALADLAENLKREIASLNRAELTEQNLARFVFRIQEIIEQMKGGQM